MQEIQYNLIELKYIIFITYPKNINVIVNLIKTSLTVPLGLCTHGIAAYSSINITIQLRSWCGTAVVL